MTKIKKIEKKNIAGIHGLTPIQEGLLFHYLHDRESHLYFEQLTLEISGEIRMKSVARAWNFVIRTNEMLRVVFRWEELEHPIQVILKEHRFQPVYFDLSGQDSHKARKRLEEIKTADRQEGFDLQEVPFRVKLCKLGERLFAMITSYHHILCDGWSSGIILSEFFAAYHRASHGLSLISQVKKPRFREFIQWQQKRDPESQKQFWENYLEGFEPQRGLPLQKKKKKPLPGDAAAATHQLTLPNHLGDLVEIFLKENRFTLAVFFYCAWGILLQNYGDTDDVLLGATISGRNAPIKGIENLVGLLIDTLPLRVKTRPGQTVRELLAQLAETLPTWETSGTAPLVDIKKYAGFEAGQELFDSLAVVENYPLETRLKLENHELRIGPYSMWESTNYAVALRVSAAHPITVELIYQAQSFAAETMGRLMAHFKNIVADMVNHPGKTLHELEILTDEEKNRLLSGFNHSAPVFPQDQTLHCLFTRQAKETPDHIALVGAENQGAFLKNRPHAFPDPQKTFYYLTYRELNEKSTRLASLLRKKGIRPDTIVGIMVKRSIEMIAGILGILKAGAAYLPIAPDYPQDRIDFMLKDSNAKILVTASIFGKEVEILESWEGSKNTSALPHFLTSQPPNFPLFPATSLAYIIYTSGSTGNPKGVPVRHGNLSPLLHWGYRFLRIGAADRVVQNLSYFFDWSVWEIFIALTSGASLHLVSEDLLLEGKRYGDFINRSGITVLHITPTHFQVLAQTQQQLKTLKYLCLGAEKLSVDLVKRCYKLLDKSCRVFNMYGPTETTIIAAVLEIHPPDLSVYGNLSGIPIGKASGNTTLLILDRNANLSPLEVPGELFIAGDAVAPGYLNNPELTAERFCLRRPGGLFSRKPPPWTPRKSFLLDRSPITNHPSPIYQTGDRCRWLPGGMVEFLGRRDQQVKIRGFRIEPGEIEKQLLRHPEVNEALVMAREKDERENTLCAYVVLQSHHSLDWNPSLRDYLSARLPAYMVPAHFVKLEHMPLNPNGKVDLKALPDPVVEAGKGEAANETPSNEAEKKLAAIWAEVLGFREPPGIDAHFFQWGGHSLTAARLVAKISRVFAVEVPLSAVFLYPTVRQMAAYLNQAKTSVYNTIEDAEQREYYPLSPAQKRLYLLQRLEEGNTIYHMPWAAILEGAVDTGRLEETFRQLIRRHESFRTSFQIVKEEPVQRVQDRVEFQVENSKLQNKKPLSIRKAGAVSIPNSKSQITNNSEGVNHHQESPFGTMELYIDVDQDPKSQELRAKSCIKCFIRPFDLSQAPLLRVGLRNTGTGKHILVVDMHHIISDGVSTGILLTDFMALYAGDELRTNRIHYTYKDFSLWQTGKRVKEAMHRQQQYWLNRFQESLPVLELPYTFPRLLGPRSEGGAFKFDIAEQQVHALKRLADEENLTLFMVLTALYHILLSGLSGSEDVAAGTAAAGREQAEFHPIIGMFVNTLVLRSRPCGEKIVKRFLAEIKQTIIEAFEHQLFPFDLLVEKLAPDRLTTHHPLFDTMFTLQNLDLPRVEIPGLNLRPYDYTHPVSRFHMTWIGQEAENEKILRFTIEYSTVLFAEETIKRFAGYYKNILALVVEAGGLNRELAGIEILPAAEKELILYEFNDTGAEYPKEKTLHRLFVEQAKKNPDHTALVGAALRGCPAPGDGPILSVRPVSLTYRELNEKSAQLASLLRKKGIQPDTIVGIMVKRSIEMIAGILGILKTGAAYLPIAPDYPQDRIDFMLKDSNANVLVTTSTLAEEGEKVRKYEGKKNLQIILLDFSTLPPFHPSTLPSFHLHLPPLVNAPAASLAYIIYTSGSTGNPKGVPVRHGNLSPLLHWGYKFLGIGTADRVVQNLAYFFDWSVWEIFIALTSGASLHMVSEDLLLEGKRYGDFINRSGITVLHITPTHFQVFAQSQQQLKTLTYLCLGAEKLSIGLVKRSYKLLDKSCRVFNMYGPTETTIIAAVLDIHPPDLLLYGGLSSIPIGKASGNTTLLILDRNSNLSPLEVAGELFIAGDAVAPGYLNNPELTAERFCLRRPGGLFSRKPPPWTPRKNFLLDRSPITNHPSPIYQTGDRCRWLPEGKVEFLGRMDQQVKIRGFRIEPGEIEKQLLQHPEVSEALVIAREKDKGENMLCAYVVLQSCHSPVWNTSLRDHLSVRLPGYMVPAHFVRLENMPLNPNGKVDIKALPDPAVENSKGEIADETPGNETEQKLAAIWSEVLGFPGPLGIDAHFFERGGHSLTAARLAAKIHQAFAVEVPLSKVFIYPTVRQMAAFLDREKRDVHTPIEDAEKREYYPLSLPQRRLYLLQRMEKGNISYTMPWTAILEGELDTGRLEETFQHLTRRHESFRTAFQVVKGEPVQRIQDSVELEIGYNEGARESITSTIRNFIRPFDLSNAPLLRVGLLKRETRKYVLMVDMHHIISDGFSTGILIKDFMALYAREKLRPDRIHYTYKDFSLWETGKRVKEALHRQEQYWLNRFQESLPVLELPYTFPRPSVRRPGGGTFKFDIAEPQVLAMKRLANAENLTLFMVLTAIYHVLLSGLSGSEDVAAGTAAAGREQEEFHHIIGMFVNTLVLRSHPRGEKTVNLFLKEIKQIIIDAFEHQLFPFDLLVEKLAPDRLTTHHPLFDTMFNLQNLDLPEVEIPGLKVRLYDYKHPVSRFDMTWIGQEVENEKILRFTIEYSTVLFAEETIKRFASYYKNILSFIIKAGGLDSRLAEIEILPAAEKKQLLYEFNDTTEEYPGDKTLHRLFAEQVERTPDHLALVGQIPGARGGMQLSYRELSTRVGELAYGLREKGVQPDTLVGLRVERSIEMIVGILGILEAGGAYLPMDAEYPAERLQYMSDDSGAGILLAAGNRENSLNIISVASRSPAAKKIPAAGCWRQTASLAYIIYTSGSAGKPKGVAVEHRAIVNTICWRRDEYGFDGDEVVMQIPSISFDSSVEDIFTPLTAGSVLVILRQRERLNLEYLKKVIFRHEVTHFLITPHFYTALLEAMPGAAALKSITVAGEGFTAELVQRHFERFPGVKLYNEYGPTENSVCSTLYKFDPSNSRVFIGKPIRNNKCYITSGNGELVPLGVPGQLGVAGVGLARGYLNNPGLTAEKFCLRWTGGLFSRKSPPWPPRKSFLLNQSPITNHQSPIYQTGDLARWQPDGNIEFLGRLDDQVKIRGFRIEPGEIEDRLLSHPYIKEAVVTVREDKPGNKYLCAYIVSAEELVVPDLPAYLGKNLPAYMIPSYFTRLEKIPLTANGKIDRKSLPGPEIKAGKGYVAPRDQVEEKLVEIWATVLGREEIGIDDHFFALGGHSLRAADLVHRVYNEFEVEIEIEEVFKHPFIRELSEMIRGRAAAVMEPGVAGGSTGVFAPILPAPLRQYYPLSAAQRRLYVLQQVKFGHTGYNISFAAWLEGRPDREKFKGVFAELIRRHESFRTSFQTAAGNPFQEIHDEVDFEIEYSSAENKSKVFGGPGTFFQKGSWSPQAMIKRFIRPFDLSRAPLLRVGLIKIHETNHLLITDMHHIISDGTSAGILIKEFMALYSGNPLSPLPVRYKDYACWEETFKQDPVFKNQETYWLRELEKVPGSNLPLDFPRPEVQQFEGSRVSFLIAAEEVEALTELALQAGASLYMAILAIFTILLSKWSDQQDLVIGTPVANRRHGNLQGIIGMFVNTLALRNFPEPGKSFQHFFNEVKERTLKAFDHQEYPFDHLVEKILGRKDRDAARNPLFDVMLVFQNMEIPEIQLPDLKLTPYPMETETSPFDLMLIGSQTQQELDMHFLYNSLIFKPETLQRLVGYFKEILRAVVENARLNQVLPISQINMLTARERRQLLVDFNDTTADYPRGKTIVDLLAAQVEKTPNNVALSGQITNDKSVSGGMHLTYREFNCRVNRLAHFLRSRGMKRESIAAVLMERSLDLVVSITAILKAGAAYLPIEVDYPEKRIRGILEESSAPFLLTKKDLISSFTFTHQPAVLFPDLLPEESNPYAAANPIKTDRPADLLYLISTSGSTGRPKGVMMEHRGLVNLLHFQWTRTVIDFSRVLQFASIAFDVSFQEIFSTLVKGGTLFLIDNEIRSNISFLLDFILKNNITTLFLPPAFLKFIFNEEAYAVQFPGCVRHIVTAGEQLVVTEPMRKYLKRNRVYLHNHYGPAESHVVTGFTMAPADEIPDLPPIGKPIDNTTISILDGSGNLQPLGVAGELFIAGAAVGRGYLNNPELTAERFCLRRPGGRFSRKLPPWTPCKSFLLDQSPITNHQSPIYKTGDLAQWLADGNIRFLGRKDHQVKIRGFRVELGEIETRLLAIENIKEAVVVNHWDEAGEPYLCAYLVLTDPGDAFHPSELREKLSGHLPAFMVPSYFIRLNEIPLNSSGKVNRGALPGPGPNESTPAYTAPGDVLEKKLVEIWAGVLAIDEKRIGIDENFFELGGHSLKGTVLISRIHREFDTALLLADVFRFPTVRRLARHLREKKVGDTMGPLIAVEPAAKQDFYELAPAQKRLYILQQMDPAGTTYNMPMMVRLTGALEYRKLETIFKTLVARHEGFRTSFVPRGKQTVQKIHDEVAFAIEYYDLTAEGTGEIDTEALNIDGDQDHKSYLPHFIRPFDLSRASLLRVGLAGIDREEHLLMVDMHHIISDGVTLEILIKEFTALYRGESLPPLRLQYRDFSCWQNRLLRSGRWQQQAEFWLKRFKGSLPELNMPLDFPRTSTGSSAGDTRSVRIDENLLPRFRECLGRTGTTPYQFLLAVFNLLLYKYTGQTDIIVGSPIGGRHHADLESIVGVFVNMVAVRNYPEPGKTFAEFLEEVKINALAAYQNQDYPFDELVNRLGLQRKPGRNPVFDIGFLYNVLDTRKIQAANLNITPYEIPHRVSRFDMLMGVWEDGGRLTIGLEYSTRLFKPAGIDKLLRHYLEILRQVTANLHLHLTEIEIDTGLKAINSPKPEIHFEF